MKKDREASLSLFALGARLAVSEVTLHMMTGMTRLGKSPRVNAASQSSIYKLRTHVHVHQGGTRGILPEVGTPIGKTRGITSADISTSERLTGGRLMLNKGCFVITAIKCVLPRKYPP
jgi:hypothetical protein